MNEHPALAIALILVVGLAAQWVAWRLRIPAIVMLCAAGLLVGPVAGLLDPGETFGELLKPAISIAVAVILFEGGLTLNFREISGTSKAVRRLVTSGAPIGWFLGTLAAHHIGGLSWSASAILGGIFVITGPTVIMPLLRQAKLASRPAALLRWEAIINDPIGAVLAVLAFEASRIMIGQQSLPILLGELVLAAAIGFGGGWAFGKLIARLFIAGHVPEYLKAPVLLAAVVAAFEATNLVLEEAGLLTVTMMGIAIANSRIASFNEIYRFKESVTVVLVSSLFVVLTATLDARTLAQIDWRAIAFVAALLFVVRPVTIFTATIGSGLSLNERLLVGWIAPRGIVAVAVSGLFGSALAANGEADGDKMVAITFLVVFATVILHGFSIGPLGRILGLTSAEQPGVLIIGGSEWTAALAAKLKAIGVETLIADRNWTRLRFPRQSGVPTFFGEVLSDDFEHHVDLNKFGHLIAATDNEAYNSLVCTEFGPEIGRTNVHQLARGRAAREGREMSVTLGGREIFDEPVEEYELRTLMREGWSFQTTRLTEEFTGPQWLERRNPLAIPILSVAQNGAVRFLAGADLSKLGQGTTILLFGPARHKNGGRATTDIEVSAGSAKTSNNGAA